MPRSPILQPDQSYTFRSYFEFPYEPDDIFAELGYAFVRQELALPRYAGNLDRLAESERRIRENLQYTSLSSEQARREVLVAPILTDLCHYTQAQLRIEYPLRVNQWLTGSLDYLVRSQQLFLVIEAKQDDLARGFTQLGAELAALDLWAETHQPVLSGAVTTGDIWRFGQLHRTTKQIVQDLNLYRVPADLAELTRMLVALLLPS